MKLAAIQATPLFTDAPDIHLLFMAGLVLLAGIAGLGTVSLLLLLTPLAALFVARTKPGRSAAVSAKIAISAKEPVKQKKPDDGASRLPSPLAHGEEAA